MLVICGIQDLQNPSWNHLTQLFIDSQVFTGIYYFFMLRFKDIYHMIKDDNLVPNQEAILGNIQQRKLQALVWWEKDIQHSILAIIESK